MSESEAGQQPQQEVPGMQSRMRPVPDCGEDSYVGLAG